jgi:hypothetical protein
MKTLFIQLPLLDSDPAPIAENEKLAAHLLRHAAESSPEGSCFDFSVLDEPDDWLDNAGIEAFLRNAEPDVIAASLYVWNVERTIRIVRAARRALPHLRVVAGGPEVAVGHPFLFRSGVFDAVVCGEGEAVFPSVLRALRQGTTTDWTHVAWRKGRRYLWGRTPPPVPDLAALLPPSSHPSLRPNRRGIAYMETSRGCPMRCAYCCYNQRRRLPNVLPVADALARARILIERGAREIRFVDPTCNAHPEFDRLLAGLAPADCDPPQSPRPVAPRSRISRQADLSPGLDIVRFFVYPVARVHNVALSKTLPNVERAS